MPFGIIGRTGPGMRQIVGFGDRSTERGTFMGDFGRAIVTNGDFTAYVCDSASTVGAAVCGGAGGSIAVLDGGSRRARGMGGLGFYSSFLQWEMPLGRRR